jgi:glucose-1-phosphate cytidylyltransferase
MKVVLFCGGLGTRLRDYSDSIPKPLVEVGTRPIIWHLMKYYAHFGHKDFILCLGYGGNAIKQYFLNYDESRSNDFVLSQGGKKIDLEKSDIEDWTIRFVDTGLHSNVGERLRRVRKYLDGEEAFLANYADCLCDINCETHVASFLRKDKVAAFVTVKVPHTFHIVHADDEGNALSLEHITESPIRLNGGFFVLRTSIFDYMKEGEELVVEPFQRLIRKKLLMTVPYDGFWRTMDTFKDKIQLDEMVAKGATPWEVWKTEADRKGNVGDSLIFEPPMSELSPSLNPSMSRRR